MRVLYLGTPSPVLSYLRDVEAEVINSEDLFATHRGKPDCIVSYGYRHILPPDICQEYGGRAINLHISLLPWNRGASPNAWSWYDDTPKGITIHTISEGVDKGDVVMAQRLTPHARETLATSYAYLQAHMFRMFVGWWDTIRRGCEKPIPQLPGGSYHSKTDTERVIMPLLKPLGWDTPAQVLINAGRKAREEAA